jgi:hypothetical protein
MCAAWGGFDLPFGFASTRFANEERVGLTLGDPAAKYLDATSETRLRVKLF